MSSEYEKCRYSDEILLKGEQLCYKCGDKFPQNFILLNHIKNFHNETCLKYLEGKCTFRNMCVYKHTTIIEQDVVRILERNPDKAPHINSHQDFPQIPDMEKRLEGNINYIEQLINNMNKMVHQMIQMMKLVSNMVITRQ